MDTIDFYRQLPVISSFAEATSGHLHAGVPGDWWIPIPTNPYSESFPALQVVCLQ